MRSILLAVIVSLLIPISSMGQEPVQVYRVAPGPGQVMVIRQPPPPPPRFDLVDAVESFVYISGGVARVANDYYGIRGMGHADNYAEMWNKRYKYGLDTRPNTGYGVRRGPHPSPYGPSHYSKNFYRPPSYRPPGPGPAPHRR